MKSVPILIVILFLSVLVVHGTLSEKSVAIVSRAALVWAADNSTTGNQTNQTVPQPAYQHEFTFDRPCFNVTKVVLNFPITNNHTVEDISTIGPSVYSYDFSSTGGASATFTFIANDVDIYTFTFKADYDNSSRRDILIALWSGDLGLESYTWTETGTEYVIHFRLNTLQESHYPTEAAVAQQVVYQMQLYIQQILTAQTNQLDSLQAGILLVTVISMAAAITSIVALLIGGFGARRRRMRPEE